MGKLIRWAWTTFWNAAQAWQLWIWLAPAGLVSAMTGISAYLTAVPLYLALVYAALAFCLTSLSVAGVFSALLRQHEWHYKTTPEGKLEYIGPNLVIDVEWDDAGNAKAIQRLNVGTSFRNSAQFSLNYKFVRYYAMVENRTSDTDELLQLMISVPAMSVSSPHPKRIDITDLHKSDIKGRLEFELVYGKPDALHYTIARSQEFDVVLHPESSVKPNPALGISVRDRNA